MDTLELIENGLLDEDYLYPDNVLAVVPVQEKFAGKGKVLQLERQISKARKKYKIENGPGSGLATSFYGDREIQKVGEMIADIFNFKIVDFMLYNDPQPNAYTYPAGYSLDRNFNFAADQLEDVSKGYRFKHKTLSTVIRVSTGLWVNSNFTDAEITAIVLHEVGHNFQHTINGMISGYSSAIFFLNFLSLCGGNVMALTNDSGIRAVICNACHNLGIDGAVNLFSTLTGISKKISLEMRALAGVLTLGVGAAADTIFALALSFALNPIGMGVQVLMNPIGKGQENISDQFASDMGYGPELTSALMKMSLVPENSGSGVLKFAGNNQFIGNVCTLFGLPVEILLSILDPHPKVPKRAVNVVRDLERELNKSDLSPAMKKEVRENINRTKEIIDRFEKDDSKDGMMLKRKVFLMLTDFDKNPRGIFTDLFSRKDMNESYMDEFLYNNELSLEEIVTMSI